NVWPGDQSLVENNISCPGTPFKSALKMGRAREAASCALIAVDPVIPTMMPAANKRSSIIQRWLFIFASLVDLCTYSIAKNNNTYSASRNSRSFVAVGGQAECAGRPAR